MLLSKTNASRSDRCPVGWRPDVATEVLNGGCVLLLYQRRCNSGKIADPWGGTTIRPAPAARFRSGCTLQGTAANPTQGRSIISKKGRKAPDNSLPPASLSAFERSHLHHVFVVIKTVQSALVQGGDILG